MISNRLRIKFDGVHPVGASHHQKLVVIDGSLAFCGGIDATSGRWDTREHDDKDPRRVTPDGDDAEPWHDLSMVFDGGAANKRTKLYPNVGNARRERPCRKSVNRRNGRLRDRQPSKTSTLHSRVPAASIKTLRRSEKRGAVFRYYRDSQTLRLCRKPAFGSRVIAAAIACRLQEADPPEFVIVMPEFADGWLEQVAMDTARSQLVAMIRKFDAKHRFRIYHPFTSGGKAIYVHAKSSTIIDDRILRIGSSNMNNRSLGFDSECDVAIDADVSGGAHVRARRTEIRDSLIAEHLGCDAKISLFEAPRAP